MAERELRLRPEDSPFRICPGKAIVKTEFNEKLNVIVAASVEGDLYVVDPTFGEVLYHTNIGFDSRGNWDFSVGSENIVVAKRDKIGIRGEYNGILLLDTILQTPVKTEKEDLLIELTKTEVETLLQALNASVDSVPEARNVEEHLRSVLSNSNGSKSNGELTTVSIKREKWSTVKLSLPQHLLKNVFQGLVTEWCKKSAYSPSLATASSILYRANELLTTESLETNYVLDKTQMFSEIARYHTFKSWPHMDYKWALPSALAQAGFYHNPQSTGDDRSMCCFCNVCLVSWEPADEPWSEHERHSPFCPFVRGEHTHNVSLSVQRATAPAFLVKQNVDTVIMVKSSCPSCTAVAYSNGLVLIWNEFSQTEDPMVLHVTSKTIANLESKKTRWYSDIEMKSQTGVVMESGPPIAMDTAVHLDDNSVSLAAVAVLGLPSKFKATEKTASPSVIVACTIKPKKLSRSLESEQEEGETILLVYGLNLPPNLPNGDFPCEKEGSKDEAECHDTGDELFGSYTECDLISDSISIFSDLNDSVGAFQIDPIVIHENKTSTDPSKKKIPTSRSPGKVPFNEKHDRKTSQSTIVVAQKLNFPPDVQRDSLVKFMTPTFDGSQLLLVVEKKSCSVEMDFAGAFIIYSVVREANIVMLDRTSAVVKRIEQKDDMPLSVCLIPSEFGETELCSVLANGNVKIWNLFDLSCMYLLERDSNDDRITSVTYCSSLGRLYCSTESGLIELYSLGVSEDVKVDSEEAQRLVGEENTVDDPRLVVNRELDTVSLRQLLQLTAFENIKPCFSVNVPPSWLKVIKAQQDRKHPQHLQHLEKDYSINTLTWKLQRTKNSKFEHLFEITTPYPTSVGHLDVKVLLQNGCAAIPNIEFTLWIVKKTSSSGCQDVDCGIDFTNQLKSKTPSYEFLKKLNAELVCGPVELAGFMDISCKSANIVMTSPALLFAKARNFYLHIKARVPEDSSSLKSNITSVLTKEEPKPTSTKSQQMNANSSLKVLLFDQSKLFKMTTSNSSGQSVNMELQGGSGQTGFPFGLGDFYETETLKQNDYAGCDWINELSISIRQLKGSTVPNEYIERKLLLTSPIITSKLLELSVLPEHTEQNLAFDLLIWIGLINLCGPPVPQIGSNYQLQFIQEVQRKLGALIQNSMLLSDRSTSHKCARLLVICLDAIEMNYSEEDSFSFVSTVLNTLLDLLPSSVVTSSASLQWFFLLLNRVKFRDFELANDRLLSALVLVSKELKTRSTNNPFYGLLRTKFGLYGTPFDEDLFELPKFSKSYSPVLNYSGLYGLESSSTSPDLLNSGVVQGLDLRDLLGSSSNLRLGKQNYFARPQGLLECEPLHFTLHAASDGTHLLEDVVPSGITMPPFSAVPLQTNLQIGQGSKKSEPDKMEQIMMLQKALKMDHGEAYFDVINDLKFYENEMKHYKQIAQIGSPIPLPHGTWKNDNLPDNILTVVLHHPSKHQPSGGMGYFTSQLGVAAGEYPQSYPSFLPSPGLSNAPKLSDSMKEEMPKAVSQVPKLSETMKEKMPKVSSWPPSNPSRTEAVFDTFPFQHLMFQQSSKAVEIEKFNSGARRFIVLDLGKPIVLTDVEIPASSDLVSLSIDTWLEREEKDAERLVIATDIGRKALQLTDMQPAPICRFLKISFIGRYGMGNTSVKIPIGMFYGYTTILSSDLPTCEQPEGICALESKDVQAHLNILQYLAEDIHCRYQLTCTKLKRLLEPLMKAEVSSFGHMSYSPKGKETNKQGQHNSVDQSVINCYHETIQLQKQLNVTKGVVKRLQKSLTFRIDGAPIKSLELLSSICTDKVRLLNEFLIESLLGSSFTQGTRSSLRIRLCEATCTQLFNDSVLENSQLSMCEMLLRFSANEPWWGSFLARTLKTLFRSSNNNFPQDRVFLLLVYMGQRSLLSFKNSSVLESAMELLSELLAPLTAQSIFLRAQIDMISLVRVLMYFCMCIDVVTHIKTNGEESVDDGDAKQGNRKRKNMTHSSRWDFIQGERSLLRSSNNSLKSTGGPVCKRRIQKKIQATKQKLDELDTVASGLGYSSHLMSGVNSHLAALGNKIEAIKQKQANLCKNAKLTSSKNLKDVLQMRRDDILSKFGISGDLQLSDLAGETEIKLNLNVHLCLTLAKSLGLLLMASNNNEDVFLVACKALAKIATCCKPVALCEIFSSNQLSRLIVKTNCSSSPLLAHAISCLFEEILDGERSYPSNSIFRDDKTHESRATMADGINTSLEESLSEQEAAIEDMIVDAEEVGGQSGEVVDSSSTSQVDIPNMDSEDSDCIDTNDEIRLALQSKECHQGRNGPFRRFPACMTSILGTRNEGTELRERLMSIQNSEILSQSLRAPVEVNVPDDWKKVSEGNKIREPEASSRNRIRAIPSPVLLSESFDQVFQMLFAENLSISIEKLLQLWISVNLDLATNTVMNGVKPIIPLSKRSISALIRALSNNTGIGVQEWGLGFQCLGIIANQKDATEHILCDPNFATMIWLFISGSGLNSHRSDIAPSAGPTVCQHFHNFLFRLRELTDGSGWTFYLKDVLLQILDRFLSGPILSASFPMDAFNKFMDRAACPDLSYENISTVLSIIQRFAHLLHQFVFYPQKAHIRSSGRSSGLPGMSASNNTDVPNTKFSELENLMHRLSSLLCSIVVLPFKKESTLHPTIQEVLEKSIFVSQFDSEECIAKCGSETPPKIVADLVLQMETTLSRLLSVLAHLNGSTKLLNGEFANGFNPSETSSRIVDPIVQLFSRFCERASQPLWAVRPLFRFLSNSEYDDFYCPLVVSETFVSIVLSVINRKENLQKFIELNCVQSICNKLVSSTERFFSSCPSFVSYWAQYMGRPNANLIFGHKGIINETIDAQDGLINVAPLGTISSTTAHPSDILLLATPPHRRARAPVWSYTFSDLSERFLELTIKLPAAFLVKKIEIVPHITSLSTTSPSAVAVEFSRSQSNLIMVPMGPPLPCSGMTTITVQFSQAEVAQTILLRLFKPESNQLGLSQIRILGCTAFNEATLIGVSRADDFGNLEASSHWMYILDRAIRVAEPNVRTQILDIAVNFPNILESCYSMLMAPLSNKKAVQVSLPHLASILFNFGSYRKEISEQVMAALLGPVQMGFSHGMVVSQSTKNEAGTSQLSTVVELIYNMCCRIPDWGYQNLKAVVLWLSNSAETAIQDPTIQVVPEYVQGISAAIWSLTTERKVDLTEIITPDFLGKLVKWSKSLNYRSELKSSLDNVICSICYNKPWLFVYLMNCVELIKPMDWVEVESDKPLDELLQTWFDDSCIWDRVVCRDLDDLKDKLTPSLLMLIRRASMSPAAANMLHLSQCLVQLISIITEFVTHYSNLWLNTSTASVQTNVISPASLIAILEFFKELCHMHEFKNWCGLNGSFWLPLMNLLSSNHLKSLYFGSQVYDLEQAFIAFLAECCLSHPNNQNTLAKCLCDTILNQKSASHKTAFLHSMSSFCRRLLIQTLLENDKFIIHMKNPDALPLKCPLASVGVCHRHPSMSGGGSDRVFFIGSHVTIAELIKAIDPFDNGKSLSEDQNKIIQNPTTSTFTDLEVAMKMSAEMKRPIKMANKKLKCEGPEQNLFKEERQTLPSLVLESVEFPDVPVPANVKLGTVMSAVRQNNPDAISNSLAFTIRSQPASTAALSQTEKQDSATSKETSSGLNDNAIPDVFKVPSITSTLEVFGRLGGLKLLSIHLPVVYPETLSQIANGSKLIGTYGIDVKQDGSLDKVTEDKRSIDGKKKLDDNCNYIDVVKIMTRLDNDWVKLETMDDFYEEMMDEMVTTSSGLPVPLKTGPTIRQITPVTGIPPHSLAAFGLFLGLPRYADILLGEREGAQCILRLVMGLCDDAEGDYIFGTVIAKTLPTLPFNCLRCLLDVVPLCTEDGLFLRKSMIDMKAIHFILACLAAFTHQNCDPTLMPGIQHELVIAATKAQSGYSKTDKSDDKSYWAKGTGFGTGSTVQSWNVELAMQKKQIEEENVACFFHVLSSFVKRVDKQVVMNENGKQFVADVTELFRQSCVFPSVVGYLRNDSILDMARHVPLYKAVLQFLRSIVSNPELLHLLVSPSTQQLADTDDSAIPKLLTKMKSIVDNYSKRLSISKKSKPKGNANNNGKPLEDAEDEGLAILIPDIQATAIFVEQAVSEAKLETQDIEMTDLTDQIATQKPKTLEDRYVEEMRNLQFAFFDFTLENEDGNGISFTVPYHYESNVRSNLSKAVPHRMKRLAQESVTLSNSLPIAYGSTIFVRSDECRLDVMKVLITGPSGTPYSNGCFEFDVYFTTEYPSAPMLINLGTTGRQRVRFNPNLYQDGKVCLSILNTWHGRPEEKWNPQTSSLLTVLVAIQSLILTAEPYFNEPGYEKSRGTDAGERNSREYNAGIQIATLEWAMLDQIKNPSACFKDIIHRHFWIKQKEIIEQCEQWLVELIVTCQTDKKAGKSVTGSHDPVTVFKNNLVLLKKELALLEPIPGFENLVPIFAGSKNQGAIMSTSSSQAATSSYCESEANAIIKAAGEELITPPSDQPETNDDKMEESISDMMKD